MSNLYPPEGRLLHTLQNRANVETLSRLRQAMARETVVEGRVTLCTPAHDLVVQLGPFTGTIPREEVSADYLKALFSKYGVIVSAKPEQRRLLERVNALYDLELEIPDALKIIQLSEKNRRLVVISVQGLRRVNGSLLPEYTPEEFQEATFSFVKYYVQGLHYDELVAENEKLKRDLNSEIAWRNRVSDI